MRGLANEGAEVRQLVRRPTQRPGEFEWDPSTGTIDEAALVGLDVVINLSGAGIGDKRWTTKRKALIYDSRIRTTGVLASRLATLDDPPALFISQSATGVYGDRGSEILTESSPIGLGNDFLARLCEDWEAAATPARDAGIRVVHPRTGIVIDRESQLIKRMLPVFKAGVGGRLGSGDQWWSWITLDDLVSAMTYLTTADLTGPVNLVAPNPVTQSDFTSELALTLKRPGRIPVPDLGLKAVLGAEKAESIAFTSARVLPKALVDSGYRFMYPTLEGALTRVLTPVGS